MSTPTTNGYDPSDVLDVPPVCKTIPACNNEGEDDANVTCKSVSDTLAYYGNLCQYTFNPKTEVLNHCIPSRATAKFNKGVECPKGVKFTVDKSTGEITNAFANGHPTNMNDHCECMTPYYTDLTLPSSERKICGTKGNPNMEFDKYHMPKSCIDQKNEQVYGPHCEFVIPTNTKQKIKTNACRTCRSRRCTARILD